MISRDSVQTLLGGTAYGSDGDKIGSIRQVYLDNTSGEPAWVTVRTGLGGSHESFVPLDQAELTDDGVWLPYDTERIKGAPTIESGRQLSGEDEDRLYAYYGVGTAGSGYDTRAGEPIRYAGYDAGTTPGSNPTLLTSDATEPDERETARSDETEPGRGGLPRLRRYVPTEQQRDDDAAR